MKVRHYIFSVQVVRPLESVVLDVGIQMYKHVLNQNASMCSGIGVRKFR